jgi:DNA-binding transcriptional MocR family regulator
MDSVSDKPLYRQIADRMEILIAAGSLRGGDRMPSVRQLSLQHRVSVPTVMQAYTLLESQSLIEAKPKSGFYVRPRLAARLLEPQTATHQSPVLSLSGFASVLSMADDMVDPTLVPFGAAVPANALLPIAKLTQLTSMVLRRSPAASINYDPAPGSLLLRRELSRRSLDWGCSLSPEDFLITVGASEALHLALLAVTKPGDAVLVESPAYYGTLNLLAQLKLQVIAVPAAAGDGLEIEAVKSALKAHRVAALLVIPNFSNPLGSLMPEANRRRLLELTAKHGVPIIEDDIYGDLPHDGPRPPCLKSFKGGEDIILCSSFSKTLAPGFRVGYIAAGKYQRRVLELKNAFNLGGSSLAALAIAEFLKTGGYERHLRKLRHTYRQQVCKMREAVAAVFPEGTKLSNPSGGFVLWLELDAKVDVLKVFQQARAKGISFAPGPLFSPDGQFRNCLRLSCGFPWNAKMEESIGILSQIIRQQD